MPERQSSSGEETTRPDAGAAGNGEPRASTAPSSSAPSNGAGRSGGPQQPSDRDGDQVTTQLERPDAPAGSPPAQSPAPEHPAADRSPTSGGPAGPSAGSGSVSGSGSGSGSAPTPDDEQPTQEVSAGGTNGSTAPGREGRDGRGPGAVEQDTTTRPTGASALATVARDPDDPPTEQIPITPPPAPPTARTEVPVDEPAGRPRRRRRRFLLVAAAVLGALVLLYAGDLALGQGSVPRGVRVAGVDVGGLAPAEAESRLRAGIGPRSTQPVPVSVGEARSELDPATAGLTVDWAATLERAGTQPLNPVTRLTSFFTARDVDVETTVDRPALDSALAELGPIVDRPPAEGTVRFDGATPVPVDPVPGQQLDVRAAADVVARQWPVAPEIALPLVVLPPSTTPEDVAAAIEEVARPAVSAPVTVSGEGGTQGTLAPEDIAAVLSFRADPAQGLVPEINQAAASEVLRPQLASSEKPGRDATLDFSSGAPVITPSQDGRGIDYPATLQDLLPVLTGTGSRQLTAVYGDQPAELTTDELNGLGITGVIGEFTTRGFAGDSGRNIRRAAEVIDGTILEPGETFSLNGATVPRNAANGYVEAGIISDGHPSRGIGGGVSQVATTVYNAAYFAGMTDVAHQEHSFYISRYPAGREATVFEGAIDLKFRNDNPTGVLIETAWTPESITVRLYGTKRYEVTSTPGQRTKPTSPKTVTIPGGEPCSPSGGAPGFTITDTRTLRELSTGKVRTETQTVTYNPSPIVVCGA